METRRSAMMVLALATGLALGPGSSCSDNLVLDETGPTGTSIFDVQIELSPPVLDFGHVEVGTEAVRTLTIINNGTRRLTIKDLAIDRESSFRIDPLEEDLVIPSGEKVQLEVRYLPARFEAAAANLVVLSDDPLLRETTVGLAGRCDPPRIDFSPQIYDFGVAYLGCAVEQPLYLSNLGDGPLHVFDLEFDSTSADLTIEVPDDTLPLDVGPGEHVVLTARFEPLAEQEAAAELTISSNDPDAPTLVGTLTGRGEEAGLVTDITHVSDNGKVDILFVVDNSGSMGDNQETLARNFDNFYRIIEDLELDWQIGVVTTDNGVLQGPIKIITPETDDVRGTFSDNAMVGASGSGWERGLEFGYQALSEPLVSSQNAGFLRPSAGLRLIMMSDEPDQSSRSVDFYVSYFQNLKPNPSMVQINAITGGRNGCSTECGAADADTRYTDAVDATGGVWASICECDFIDVLEVLAEESQVYQDTFPLSQDPVPETIVVTVDGTASTDWHYESRYNAVIFNSPEVTPSNGATVTITYELALDCAD